MERRCIHFNNCAKAINPLSVLLHLPSFDICRRYCVPDSSYTCAQILKFKCCVLKRWLRGVNVCYGDSTTILHCDVALYRIKRLRPGSMTGKGLKIQAGQPQALAWPSNVCLFSPFFLFFCQLFCKSTSYIHMYQSISARLLLYTKESVGFYWKTAPWLTPIY